MRTAHLAICSTDAILCNVDLQDCADCESFSQFCIADLLPGNELNDPGNQDNQDLGTGRLHVNT